jgi:succinate dehydrogenase/fumarate reductase flavoprotein subunit
MHLKSEISCDVLVVGSGIAGIMAAMEAAGQGRSVILASSANLFSGSSFYPGTWGLGLIGPENQSDEADLSRTIQEVGCQMADPRLVDVFVAGIHPAIEKLKAMGIKLRRANNAGQREFIPCFDHKHRDWNGIEFASAKTVFARRMADLRVEAHPFCELVEICLQDGQVAGAVVLEAGVLKLIACGALVLASGGFGGLFKYRLNTDDVTGAGQSLALKCGARLINVEFMQMMPGYISPSFKTIFNEKTFRYVDLKDPSGQPLLHDLPNAQALLEERSTHGPFTSRLTSKAIDLALFKAFLKHESGVTVTYSREMLANPPEFIQTYFDWLAEAKHLTPNDPVQIGFFAHASNGGIQIDTDTSTGVNGLFACGEATGGMHGADRIGGLSTANGLVFGIRAGLTAASFASRSRSKLPLAYDFDAHAIENSNELRETLRDLMFQNAMVIRTEAGLLQAQKAVDNLASRKNNIPAQDPKIIASTHRLEAQILSAQAILQAALLRRESRGSHFRSDFPDRDEQMNQPILIDYDGSAKAHFKKGLQQDD